MNGIEHHATLYGCLAGPIWMPDAEATPPLVVDVKREAHGFVNATGSRLVDALKATVDGSGDFRSARLISSSVMLEPRRLGGPDPHEPVAYWARRVVASDLPSLADYVTDTWSTWDHETP